MRRRSGSRPASEAGPPTDPPQRTGSASPLFGRSRVEMLLQSAPTSRGAGEGTHVTFLDMGGQPEFWQLVSGFLRNKSVITVFGRLDEIEANLATGERLKDDACSDSNMCGIDELMLWLDAVAASTADGPVLIALSRADKVILRLRPFFTADNPLPSAPRHLSMSGLQ